MKIYYLMISRQFPTTHPRKKMPTGFVQAILDEIKIHTIRLNYEYWLKIANEINEGKAILSLRYWKDKPYHSKQIEFYRVNKLGIQKLDIGISIGNFDTLTLKIDDIPSEIMVDKLAQNDGLSLNDFFHWFFPTRKTINHQAAILHFTDFRYE